MTSVEYLATEWLLYAGLGLGAAILAVPLAALLTGMRFIANTQVGIVEKLWSRDGGVNEGHLIVVGPEVGYQASVLRGGIHFGYWRWQYQIHRVPLTIISPGRIGCVFARDGESLPPDQTLGRVVQCNSFQDAAGFLTGATDDGQIGPRGQRGRQRQILREGVYAINLALFVVITEQHVYRLALGPFDDDSVSQLRRDLLEAGAFGVEPVPKPLVSFGHDGPESMCPQADARVDIVPHVACAHRVRSLVPGHGV